MTETTHDKTQDPGHPSEDVAGGTDAVDYGKVVGVGVASLIIFALSIWWASHILHSETEAAEAKTGKAREVDTTRTEIGIVDQVPFASDTRLAKWRTARRLELETYGWVDKATGKVHIPIEAAMEKVVSGVMPAGAPR